MSIHSKPSDQSSRPWGAPTETKKPGHSALRKGRTSSVGQIYFITTTTAKRKPIFENFNAAWTAARTVEDKTILIDAKLLAWVLMPDHFHCLLALDAQKSLQQMMNRLKSASARRVNQALGYKGSLWDKGYYDHALRQEEDLLATARYIVANPVRAGLVKRVGDYPFWNAIWLP
jgi:putative transposase